MVNRESVAFVEFAAIHDALGFVAVFFEDDELALAAVREFTEKTRLHYTGVVQDKNVAGIEEFI